MTTAETATRIKSGASSHADGMHAKGPERRHRRRVKIESKSRVSDNADGAQAKIRQGSLAGSKVSPSSPQ
jgi:hypothetical protein